MTRLLLTTSLCLSMMTYTAVADDDSSSIEIAYISDYWYMAKGGISDDKDAYINNIDISYTTKLGSGTFFAYGLYNNNTTVTDSIAGDYQTLSNIDNDELFRLQELWYELPFLNDKATVKFGLIDLNSEFDAMDHAGLFINSSHGIGPEFSQTGENGPSIYPATSLAVRLIYQPNEMFDWRFGVFDAVPHDPDNSKKHKISLNEGALITSEVNFYGIENLRLGAGVWAYTSKFDTLDGNGRQDGNLGGYIIAETQFESALNGWVRYGYVNKQTINEVKYYLGTGVVYNGPLGREDDQVGFAVAIAAPSNGLPSTLRSEKAFELTYSVQVTDWLRLQPDVQYIVNPSFDPMASDLLAMGIRAEIGYSF